MNHSVVLAREHVTASILRNLPHLMTRAARGSNTVTTYLMVGLVTAAHSTLGVIAVNHSGSG
jgi:hypothetical protein